MERKSIFSRSAYMAIEKEKQNYKIVGKTNVVSESENGEWNLEANLVSWFGHPPRLELRHWTPDHMKMDKGPRFSKEEAIKLRDTLVSMNIEEMNF
jgi:hypothetical protein